MRSVERTVEEVLLAGVAVLDDGSAEHGVRVALGDGLAGGGQARRAARPRARRASSCSTRRGRRRRLAARAGARARAAPARAAHARRSPPRSIARALARALHAVAPARRRPRRAPARRSTPSRGSSTPPVASAATAVAVFDFARRAARDRRERGRAPRRAPARRRPSASSRRSTAGPSRHRRAPARRPTPDPSALGAMIALTMALVPGDPLAHRALESLLRAEASVRRRLTADLEREGLSASGFSVLVVLTTAGGELELRALRRRLRTSKANATEVVGTLAARGLVVRSRLPHDRRAAAVALTPLGHEIVERLFPEHSARVERAFAVLDDDREARVRRALPQARGVSGPAHGGVRRQGAAAPRAARPPRRARRGRPARRRARRWPATRRARGRHGRRRSWARAPSRRRCRCSPRCARAGRRVLLPLLREDMDLEWAEFETAGRAAPGAPRDPRAGRARRSASTASRAAGLVLAPALAVDRARPAPGPGRRLLRPRAGARRRAPVVAVVFDDEVLDEVPVEAHDRRVAGVLTPDGGLRWLHSDG